MQKDILPTSADDWLRHLISYVIASDGTERSNLNGDDRLITAKIAALRSQ